MAERDPYAVVGVPVHASTDAVAAACRDLARRHHPDVSTEPDAQAHMAAINEACSILRNPVRRAAWDRINLRILDRAGGQPADGTTHPRRRSSRHAVCQHGSGRMAARTLRRGCRRPAAGSPARIGAPVRPPHRVVTGRDRARGPGLPRMAPAGSRRDHPDGRGRPIRWSACEHGARRLAARAPRRGCGRSAARSQAWNRAPVRSPHRVVPGRDRTRGSRLPRLAPGPPRGRAVPGRDRPGAPGHVPDLDGGAGARPVTVAIPFG